MARLSVPTLPANIEMMIIIRPASDKCGVTPVDKPTVPTADISSKSKLRNDLSGSVMVSEKVETNIKIREKTIMEYALRNTTSVVQSFVRLPPPQHQNR